MNKYYFEIAGIECVALYSHSQGDYELQYGHHPSNKIVINDIYKTKDGKSVMQVIPRLMKENIKTYYEELIGEIKEHIACYQIDYNINQTD